MCGAVWRQSKFPYRGKIQNELFLNDIHEFYFKKWKHGSNKTRSGDYSRTVAAQMTPENVKEVARTRDASDPKGEATIAGTLARYVDELGMDSLPVAEMDVALYLPWPFCHLITRGKWKHVALNTNSQWPRNSSISRIARVWRRYELADNEPSSVLDDNDAAEIQLAKEDLFQTRTFQDLADYLRDNSSVLASSSTDPEMEVMRVGGYVRFLEQCVGALSEQSVTDSMVRRRAGRGGRYYSQIGQRAEYFCEFFVKVICFALDLRSDKSTDGGGFVKRTFKKAIKLMPPEVRNMLEELYTDSTFFPSQATVSRANLYIDVAFMRVMAERHEAFIKQNVIVFLMTDASPMHNRLYQITEYYLFGVGIGIEKAGETTCRLRLFSKKPLENISEADVDVMMSLVDLIKDAVAHHTFAPMCMDSRNSGTVVRSHCVIQQVRLEITGWETAQGLFLT